MTVLQSVAKCAQARTGGSTFLSFDHHLVPCLPTLFLLPLLWQQKSRIRPLFSTSKLNFFSIEKVQWVNSFLYMQQKWYYKGKVFIQYRGRLVKIYCPVYPGWHTIKAILFLCPTPFCWFVSFDVFKIEADTDSALVFVDQNILVLRSSLYSYFF